MASKKILIQVDVTTKSAEVQINKVVDSMNELEGATAKFADTTKKSRAQSGLNNAILIESGRFASDLRFGFTAVANNLGRIIELGQEFSRTEGGGLVPALRRIISVQGLFLIGFQLLVAYGDKVFAFLKGLVTEVNATKDVFSELSKEIGEQSTNFEVYISKLQDSNTSQEEQAVVIKKLNDEFPDFIDNLKESGISMEDIKNQTKDANIAIENQRKQLIALAKSRAAMNKIQEIQSDIIDETMAGEERAIELGYESFEAAVERLEELDAIESKKRTREEARERGRLLAIGNNIRNINKRILAGKEEMELLMEFVNFTLGPAGDANEKENKYSKDRVDNFNREISEIKKLGKIQNDFAVKRAQLNSDIVESDKISFDQRRTNLESEGIQQQHAIDLQEAQSLKELDQLELSEELKAQARLNIELYYDDLRKKNKAETSKAIVKIDDLETQARLDNLDRIGQGLMAASQIAGKATGAGKALAVAGTLLSTYSAAQKAYESQMTLTPDSPIRAAIAAAVATTQGLARVQSILAVKTPAMKEQGTSGGGATGAGTTIEAPDFNVVGAGGVSQLAAGLAGITGRPLKAFVVSKEISSAQELDRNITNNAQID